ncbi:hypothetical protein FNV43_RR26818 [Rhamnella rubrinervis]|uniref:ENTH domain-containing protein n=1 Tax=Rhamnella rubrinervis TaxID=2594499 RepID=A0A8K0DQ20_9ROSA|nr:hypothetical protein FNV43_RR26818 [Rhamnella rubrinervis]
MQRRFRRIFTSLKERSSVNYAKMVTVGGLCNLEIIIIKATPPDDLPLPEKYVHELLKVFSISQSSFKAFSLGFTRRFGKTKCWRVALKCLLLLHRLLRSLPPNSPFRSELLWSRSNGLLSLYPCHFRDESSSASENYTAFIRSYAHLLDEALYSISMKINEVAHHHEEEEELVLQESISDKMKELGQKLEVLPQLQSLIDRIMDCRPVGPAARSFIVQSAMKHIIRESFACYKSYRKDMAVVLDNLFQLPYKSSVLGFGIYKKAAVQANQLSEFYDWCKAKGLCGAYEYPFIDRIPHIQIQALETFLNGMWELTESSSSTSGSSSSTSGSSSSVVESRWTFTEEEGDRVLAVALRKFNGDEEEPLIKFEDDSEDKSWETLLEASINVPPGHQSLMFFNSNGYITNGYGDDSGIGNGFYGDGKDDFKMEMSNSYALNSVHQYQCLSMPNHQGSFASNNSYPRGL